MLKFLLRRGLRLDERGSYQPRVSDHISIDGRTFGKLVKMSDATERATRLNIEDDVRWVESSVAVLLMFHGLYLSQIDPDVEDSPEVAQIMLLCRFTNAIYAATRLAMMGLMLESANAFRSALEALQFSRLIHIEPAFAARYLDPQKAMRPVEVRRELESRGHDVAKARAQYSFASTTAHLGGFGESLILSPDGDFDIGGYVDPKLQRKLLTDCHMAVGEYVAFHAGVRQEHVRAYHENIKQIAKEAPNITAALAEIEALQELYKTNGSNEATPNPG